MKLSQAKEYFELHLVVGFEVLLEPMQEGCYYLLVKGTVERSWVLDTAMGQRKVYSSADSVLRDISRITGRQSSGFSVGV